MHTANMDRLPGPMQRIASSSDNQLLRCADLRSKAAVQDPIILAELCGNTSKHRRTLRWGGYLRGQKHMRFHDGQSSCKISNVMPLATEVSGVCKWCDIKTA